MPDKNITSTTQQYLDIYDITNDLVLMKNGTTSLILSVSAMNFGLLAEEEQDSIIYAYAGLLNSLNYPIQIIIRSQTKDVTSYLQKLKDQEDRAESRENQTRIRRYREFVSNLIHERNVLDKKFYVVIPASPIELGLMPIKSVIPGQQQFDISTVERSLILEKSKNLLEPKRDHLSAQFARIGLYSYQLTTQEIIQLFYLSYNPEASEGQQIAESHSYSTPLVKASFEGIPMFSTQNNDQNPAVGQGATPVSQPTMTAPQQPGVAPGTTPGAAPGVTPVAPPTPEPELSPAPVAPATEPPTQEEPANILNMPTEAPAPTASAPEETPVEIPGFELANHPQTTTPTAQTLSGEGVASTDDNTEMQDEINKTLGQIGSAPVELNLESAGSAGLVPPTNPTAIGDQNQNNE